MSAEIGIEKLIKHMGWANQQIIHKLGELPNDAFQAYLVNPEWTVAEIIRHILSSADWYGFRLTGEMHMEFVQPKSASEMVEFARMASVFDDRLLRASKVPEVLITREVDGKTLVRARSTILSQSVHHATEHRAQLVAALESRGFTSINLDDFDLWAYTDGAGE
ncbi:MAG: DinB family protein [Actinomycetes bacterium]